MGKKKRQQGKPVEFQSLEEFKKETPSRMNVPRQPSPSDAQWGKVDLSDSKIPSIQATKYSKQYVSEDTQKPDELTQQLPKTTEQTANKKTKYQGMGDFASVGGQDTLAAKIFQDKPKA